MTSHLQPRGILTRNAPGGPGGGRSADSPSWSTMMQCSSMVQHTSAPWLLRTPERHEDGSQQLGEAPRWDEENGHDFLARVTSLGKNKNKTAIKSKRRDNLTCRSPASGSFVGFAGTETKALPSRQDLRCMSLESPGALFIRSHEPNEPPPSVHGHGCGRRGIPRITLHGDCDVRPPTRRWSWAK